jgi:hypothetical protein
MVRVVDSDVVGWEGYDFEMDVQVYRRQFSGRWQNKIYVMYLLSAVCNIRAIHCRTMWM